MKSLVIQICGFKRVKEIHNITFEKNLSIRLLISSINVRGAGPSAADVPVPDISMREVRVRRFWCATFRCRKH